MVGQVICLAHALNPAEAHSWRVALEEADVACQVVGDYLDAGLGDIPGLQAELWVPAAQLDRAREILAGHLPHQPEFTRQQS